MKIFYRYMITEVLKMLVPIWLGLGALMFLLEWLAQVFNLKASASTIFFLYLYKMPSHLQLSFPIAALLSVLIVLGNMNRNREITAIQAMGIKMQHVYLAVMAAVAIASIPNYWSMDVLSPMGMKAHYELYDNEVSGEPSRFTRIKRDRIWFRNKDVLYNVGHFDPDKNILWDLTIYTFDENFYIAQTLYAKSAHWMGDKWELRNGVISLTDKRLATPVRQSFDKRMTRLLEKPNSLKRIERDADTMSQAELWNFITRNHALGINTVRWEVVYQGRYSFLVIPFVLLLFGFPMSLQFRRTGGRVQEGAVVAMVSLVYWLFYSFGMNLGSNGKLNPIMAAWGPSILFGILVLIYLKTRSLRTESA